MARANLRIRTREIIARIKSDYFTAYHTGRAHWQLKGGCQRERERERERESETERGREGKERYPSNCEYKFRVLFSLPAPSWSVRALASY